MYHRQGQTCVTCEAVRVTGKAKHALPTSSTMCHLWNNTRITYEGEHVALAVMPKTFHLCSRTCFWSCGKSDRCHLWHCYLPCWKRFINLVVHMFPLRRSLVCWPETLPPAGPTTWITKQDIKWNKEEQIHRALVRVPSTKFWIKESTTNNTIFARQSFMQHTANIIKITRSNFCIVHEYYISLMRKSMFAVAIVASKTGKLKPYENLWIYSNLFINNEQVN